MHRLENQIQVGLHAPGKDRRRKPQQPLFKLNFQTLGKGESNPGLMESNYKTEEPKKDQAKKLNQSIGSQPKFIPENC